MALPALVTFVLCHGEPLQHWVMESFSFIRIEDIVLKTFLTHKVEKYEFTPSSFVCVFFPPAKRVISAASEVSRDFIVELISHSVAYKHKMPAQICQVSSLLHDTYLSVHSCQSSVFSTLPCLQASKSLTASNCARALLQVQIPSVVALPGVILPPLLSLGRGISRGSHTPAQATGGSEGQKIITEGSPPSR